MKVTRHLRGLALSQRSVSEGRPARGRCESQCSSCHSCCQSFCFQREVDVCEGGGAASCLGAFLNLPRLALNASLCLLSHCCCCLSLMDLNPKLSLNLRTRSSPSGGRNVLVRQEYLLVPTAIARRERTLAHMSPNPVLLSQRCVKSGSQVGPLCPPRANEK